MKESTGLPYVLRAEACSESGKWVPVSHACGRDCQMAVVLAAAHVLSSPRDALPGDVLLMFQLAEEGAPLDEVGGAQAMLDAGAFQRAFDAIELPLTPQ
ncbi:M20/M25/M40 family metallo-hydrolase [Streptomyces sp. NPDC057575]|uniref:M20/M25/M40 family metallo-hydrolase n=1 Tax=unclassified Streptomyces TaxID=2593676 RepID=UPI00367E6FF3